MKKQRRVVLTEKVLRKYVESAKKNLFLIGGTMMEGAISFGWDEIHGKIPEHLSNWYKDQITETLKKIRGCYTVMVNVYHEDSGIESETIHVDLAVPTMLDKIASEHLATLWNESDENTRLSCAYLVVPRDVEFDSRVLGQLTSIMELKGCFDKERVDAAIAADGTRDNLSLNEFEHIDELRPMFKELHRFIADCSTGA